MENQDKTYMWLMILAFIGLVVATGFAFMELNELRSENQAQPSKLFDFNS